MSSIAINLTSKRLLPVRSRAKNILNHAQRSLVTTSTLSPSRPSWQYESGNSYSSSCRPRVGPMSFVAQHQPQLQVRSLSNIPPAAGGTLNGSPAYTVFAETCLLGLKTIMPAFRALRNNTVVVDGNKPGRIVFEWVPRTADGKPNRDALIRFALSPEECGLVLYQLSQQQKVEFSRMSPQEYGGGGGGGYADANNRLPNKVMTITPGQHGMVSVKVDYEKDGVGGQNPGFDNAPQGPLEVIVQAGEWNVIQSILQTSMPYLTGWVPTLEMGLNRCVADALEGGGSGGPRFSTSDNNHRGTPF